MTEAKYASEVIITKDIPYLALTGELWAVFVKIWVKIDSIIMALYFTLVSVLLYFMILFYYTVL